MSPPLVKNTLARLLFPGHSSHLEGLLGSRYAKRIFDASSLSASRHSVVLPRTYGLVISNVISIIL